MSKGFISSSILRSAIAVVVVGCALAMANADAAIVRTHYVTATAACAGPIPSSDGALRRSPLGIRNQGSDNVFISCSVPADSAGDQTAGTVNVAFWNFGTADVTVNCTLTAGTRYAGYGSVAGSVTVSAGNSETIVWLDIDKKDIWGSYNFSCILPPNIEINTIVFSENDAADGL